MRSIFLLLIPVSVLAACKNNGRSEDSFRDFIPGTYAIHFEQEYSTGQDTIVIEPLETKASTFRMLRISVYRRILKGKIQPEERTVIQWTGVYHPQEGILQEAKTGKQFSFSQEKGIMLYGSRSYQKVK